MAGGAAPLAVFLESTRKINIVGKKSVDRPGKPGDCEELASFWEIALFHFYYQYNMCAITDGRGWPPDASLKYASRMRFDSFAAPP